MKQKPSAGKVRRVLDVVVDILSVLAITLAGIGHVGPWFYVRDHEAFSRNLVEDAPFGVVSGEHRDGETREEEGGAEQQRVEDELSRLKEWLIELQTWHAVRSGGALGATLFFVFVSLAVQPGRGFRKLLVLLMFAASLTALVFQVMLFSPYHGLSLERVAGEYRVYEDWGFIMAIVATSIVTAFCLIRMTWTMTVGTGAAAASREEPGSAPLAG